MSTRRTTRTAARPRGTHERAAAAIVLLVALAAPLQARADSAPVIEGRAAIVEVHQVVSVTASVSPTPTVTATPGCGLAPEVGCRLPTVPGKASIALTANPDDAKDKLAWTWAKGSATAKAEFGDPLAATAYDLCIYDATPTLVLSASIPPAGVCGVKPCWKATRHGFVYANRFLTPDGVQKVTLTEGLAGKAKIAAKGKGVNLDMPPLPLTPPVRVQLKSTAGVCWGAIYSVPSKNDATQFKAKDRTGATPSASPVRSPTLTASATPGAPTPTVTSAATGTTTPTDTPVPTPSATSTASETPTTTVTLSATATLTALPTLTATPMPTVTATPAVHYVDNGDGTVTDNYTGLMWEQKDGVVGGGQNYADPHAVDNYYTWSATGTAADGTAFTQFLATLNTAPCFAGHCDWRLPSEAGCNSCFGGFGSEICPCSPNELETILDLGQGYCSGGGSRACIDPIFGPTAPQLYWSATTIASTAFQAWAADFGSGVMGLDIKEGDDYVRAVRGGS